MNYGKVRKPSGVTGVQLGGGNVCITSVCGDKEAWAGVVFSQLDEPVNAGDHIDLGAETTSDIQNEISFIYFDSVASADALIERLKEAREKLKGRQL